MVVKGKKKYSRKKDKCIKKGKKKYTRKKDKGLKKDKKQMGGMEKAIVPTNVDKNYLMSYL